MYCSTKRGKVQKLTGTTEWIGVAAVVAHSFGLERQKREGSIVIYRIDTTRFFIAASHQ